MPLHGLFFFFFARWPELLVPSNIVLRAVSALAKNSFFFFLCILSGVLLLRYFRRNDKRLTRPNATLCFSATFVNKILFDTGCIFTRQWRRCCRCWFSKRAAGGKRRAGPEKFGPRSFKFLPALKLTGDFVFKRSLSVTLALEYSGLTTDFSKLHAVVK